MCQTTTPITWSQTREFHVLGVVPKGVQRNSSTWHYTEYPYQYQFHLKFISEIGPRTKTVISTSNAYGKTTEVVISRLIVPM